MNNQSCATLNNQLGQNIHPNCSKKIIQFSLFCKKMTSVKNCKFDNTLRKRQAKKCIAMSQI